MRLLLTADPELPVPPRLYGGIERIVAGLASGLVQRGHDVAIVAHAESDRNVGWQVFPWPATRSQHWPSMVANTIALQKARRSFAPDVIHSFSRLFYLGPMLLAGRPKVMSFQRAPSARTVGWAARLAGESLTFTGCSEAISSRGREAGGRWETIHNFVELDRFQFSPTVSPQAPFVFLSRIERIKGAHTAIAACRLAKRRLIIAGNHSDACDENGEYWRKEIAPHIGHDGIEYVGEVDDLQKNALLGTAAALIVPIDWEEPFGIVFAEALACGTPVISCPRGALPEIVRNGIDGFLVKNEQEAVLAIESIDRVERSACRARVEECFSSVRVVELYENLYRKMIEARS
jgi:glycosyltransferase involved in cell wall biosynthesis